MTDSEFLSLLSGQERAHLRAMNLLAWGPFEAIMQAADRQGNHICVTCEQIARKVEEKQGRAA